MPREVEVRREGHNLYTVYHDSTHGRVYAFAGTLEAVHSWLGQRGYKKTGFMWGLTGTYLLEGVGHVA